MNKIDSSKVIVIDTSGEVRFQGDVNDSVLHVINLRNYGLSVYGNTSVFRNFTDKDSPNKPCYYLLKEGNIVILNLSRFGDKFVIGYIPFSVNEIQRAKYNYILDNLVDYEILTNFMDEEIGEDLIGFPVQDSYDEDFYETRSYLQQEFSKEK